MIKDISIIFFSIFLESIPFLLLGCIISAIIEEFVSDDTIAKLIPKNVVFGSIVGIILGFFLPACDCAVIPVTKRLIHKKVPLNVAVSFMLSSPIINPVVLLSTYSAFYQTNRNIFYSRIVLGILVSLIIGILMGIIFHKEDVLIEKEECNCSPEDEQIEEEFKELKKYTVQNRRFIVHFKSIIKDIGDEFFDVVKYLIFGAVLASVIQVILPRNAIELFSNQPVLSILILMIFAYGISLCSTSDSFVGKSLLSSFGETGVIAYLLLGPMIDIKNTVVLLGNYHKKFVFVLIGLIFITIFIISLVVSFI